MALQKVPTRVHNHSHWCVPLPTFSELQPELHSTGCSLGCYLGKQELSVKIDSLESNDHKTYAKYQVNISNQIALSNIKWMEKVAILIGYLVSSVPALVFMVNLRRLVFFHHEIFIKVRCQLKHIEHILMLRKFREKFWWEKP